MNTQVTLTITVNLAAADKWEGDAEFKLSLPERHLRYLDRNQLATELDQLISQAIAEYTEKNS